MRTKIRFIALTVVLLLMTAVSVAYVLIDGGTYTECIDSYAGARLKTETTEWDTAFESAIKAEDFNASLERKGVVSLDRVYVNGNNELCIDFSAVSKGSAKAIIENDKAVWEIPLYVNEFGVVFQTMSLNFDGCRFIEVMIIVGWALIFIVTAFSFVECGLKALYSYSMVAFGGIALFCGFLVGITVYDLPNISSFRTFLHALLDTGLEFAFITSPIMLILSGAIAVSNIWLLRHEGFRLQNMLGIALGMVWMLAIVSIVVLFDLLLNVSLTVAVNIRYCISYIVSFMECLLLSTVISAFLSTRHKPPYDRDYLIILGCCIRPDGSLTPILKGRADAAIRFEKEQFSATGRHAKFIPSGGQGADEVISESEAMKRYLLEQGYPEEQIIKEDRSVNTDQNIAFSRDKIIADAGEPEDVKVGIATTNYHIFRGYVLAQKHGLNAEGISAKTKRYFYPNAFLREFAGLLFARKWKIMVVMLLILITYIWAERMLTYVF